MRCFTLWNDSEKRTDLRASLQLWRRSPPLMWLHFRAAAGRNRALERWTAQSPVPETEVMMSSPCMSAHNFIPWDQASSSFSRRKSSVVPAQVRPRFRALSAQVEMGMGMGRLTEGPGRRMEMMKHLTWMSCRLRGREHGHLCSIPTEHAVPALNIEPNAIIY